MTKSTTTRSRAEEFESLEAIAAQDFDPEDDHPEFSKSDSSGSESGRAGNGRGHYASVEKSKLRRRDLASLGPQYTGSRISRNKLVRDDEEHDPFAEYGSDEESGRGDSAAEEELSSSESPSLNGEGGDEYGHEDHEIITDGTSVDDENDEDEEEEYEDMEADHDQQDATDRAQLRQIMDQDRKHVASAIAQATKADAEKGNAVKEQRQMFDSVLNGRIRLQQALVAINSLTESDLGNQIDQDYSAATKGAEKAAVNLWNTIESVKQSLEGASGGVKRKRHNLTLDTPLPACWTWMRDNEAARRAHRRGVLQKWSTKTQSATLQPSSRKLIGSSSRNPTILNVLDEQLTNTERLVKRTRMPRSCAPVQARAGLSEANGIFDDADFYGVLLKELLEQKSIDAGGANLGADGVTRQLQAAREAKVKKQVDTKASKGRKLRYTVQERLQNFMAPEDRRTWGERQIDELFGSLLGRRLVLGEGVDEEAGLEEEGNAEEEALRLFRS